MSIFAALDVYHDKSSRSAAMNMAIDEALLEFAPKPSIRFYQWDHPALSFGYFGRFADIENEPRDLVRRWTGGGIVLHGEDLTYSLVIPSSDPSFSESSISIYEKVHKALEAGLVASGQQAELASIAGSKISESCFANPVRADVLSNGRKVAGAAQRREQLLQELHRDLPAPCKLRDRNRAPVNSFRKPELLLAQEAAHVALSRKLLGKAFNGAAEGAMHVGCAIWRL